MMADKINKLTLPATIIIASIILGGFFYASQVNKQKSIEKQQGLELEQEHKEYVAKRRLECYDIEQRERENYNNVDDCWYNGIHDVCKVRYENEKWEEGNPPEGRFFIKDF
jgi:hypothetical protein